MAIELFDKTNIDLIQWPETEEANQARAFLLPMLKEGVTTYIQNVETELFLLKIDDQIIPITVNHHEYQNSYLTSNFFLIKYLEEVISQKKSWFLGIHKPLIHVLGFFLKLMKINKVVIVNNWLLTTNIYPKLTEVQIEAITSFLKKRFSDHLLVFRSLNTCKYSDLTLSLQKLRYRLMGSRFVYMYDPEKKSQLSSKALYHHRRDRRLIQSEGYEVVRGDQFKGEEIEKILKLYHHIYISRHTKYSPQYTERFIQEAMKSRFFDIVGLKKEGEIHGVIGCHERNETLIVPFFGYDTKYGEANHLYRILTILAIDEAEKRGIILNDGSGGSTPKRYRGMEPFPEYVAFYDRHLPFARRLFWWAAEIVVQKIAFPLAHKKIIS